MPTPWLVQEDGTYRSGNLILAAAPNERILAHLYFRFEADKRMRVLFYEGEQPSLKWFLSEYSKPEVSALACYREGDTGDYEMNGKCYSPVGLIWINRTFPIGIKFRKAEVAMGFIRGVSFDETFRFGQMAVDWSFSNLKLDALFGTTPTPNRAARFFGERLGFQQTTPLEGYSCWNGKLCSVIFQSMTRTRWEGIKSGSGSGLEEAA